MKSNTTKQLPILFSQWKVNGGREITTITPTILLDKWNGIFATKLRPSNICLIPLSSNEIELLINESENDQETIRALLIEDLTGQTNTKDKEQYVKLYQTFLIRLLDTLFGYSKTMAANPGILGLYNTISQHLQCTLDFIEDFFSNYFDRSEKVPEPYFTIAKEDIKKQLKQLRLLFSKNGAIDSSLSDLIYDCVNQLLHSENILINYSQLAYYKTLLSELSSLKLRLSAKSIIDTLFYINFNEDNFIAYEYDWLKQLTEKEVTNNAKIAVLRYEQKIINQQPIKLHCCFNQNMPSLRDQINGWISEEVKYLENVQMPTAVPEKSVENEDKIHTSLSVAKLAIIIRLLVVDKIIINRTVAPMLRVVARIFTTLQKDDISFGSLETKYHAPDKATINAVKDMLFKWINILNRL